MPDLSNRAKHEAKIAKLLGKLGGDISHDVTNALGDPPDIAKLTPELWRDIQTRYTGALMPQLEKVFLDALQEQSTETAFTIDWTVANQRASDWARQYTYDLVTGIDSRSQTLLQGAVNDFFQNGLTIDDLTEKISGIFGPVRAEMIAVTEVTRAVSQGGKLLIDELAKQGAQMIAVWNTSNDDIVRRCPVCWPRHEKKQGDNWTEPPPAHVSCRCWLSYEPVES